MSQRENGLIDSGCCALARLEGVGFACLGQGRKQRELGKSVNKVKCLDKTNFAGGRVKCCRIND